MRQLINDFAQWLNKKSYTPPRVEYYSHIPGMEKWAPVQPTSRFIPSWYKNLPVQATEDTEQIKAHKEGQSNHRAIPHGIHPDFNTWGHTIKTCPGMQDILTLGYTVPFWSNSIISTTLDGKQILTHSATTGSATNIGDAEDSNGDHTTIQTLEPDSVEVKAFLMGLGYTEEDVGDWRRFHKRVDVSASWKTHPESQYSTMIDELPEDWCKVLLKLETKWRISTPKGWSMLLVDPTFQFNDCIQAVPGVLNTDYWHESNMFFFVKKRGIQFAMEFGQPLITHIAIQRKKLPLEIRQATASDLERDKEAFYLMTSQWKGSKAYRLAMKTLGFKQEGGKCPYKHK